MKDFMIKIDSLKPEDRTAIYKLLQQSEDMSLEEISQDIGKIDRLLFENNSSIEVVVARSLEENIAGFAIYSKDPVSDGTFSIHRIWISPLLPDNSLMEILLRFVESEIKRMEGIQILMRLPSDEKHEVLRKFFESQNYTSLSSIENYYKKGIHQIIFGKTIFDLSAETDRS